MSRPAIFHVTPITPNAVLEALAGRRFLISYARPDQAEIVERIASEIIYDNAAFQAHTLGTPADFVGFLKWVRPRLDRPGRWAIIPDIIAAAEEDQDRLLAHWPRELAGMPVWHSDESLARLFRLIDAGWQRIAIGSSAEHWIIGSPAWLARFAEIDRAILALRAWPSIHLLRGASMAHRYSWIASADASSLAQNHHRYRKPLFRGTPDEYRGVLAYADKLEGRKRHEQVSTLLQREVRQ